MLDKNVGDALLRLDLSPQADPPTAQVERIIDSDRLRVKRWTRIAVALWILAALGAISIFILGGLVFPMIAKLLMEEQHAATAGKDAPAEKNEIASDKTVDAEGPLDNPRTPLTVLAKLVAMCMVFGTASFMVLVLAGLATVLLLVRSRTATLRQINANLLQISEQLKRVPPGTTPAPS
jgi:hypothetical protein